MFCTSCGKELNDGDMFCTGCGKRITLQSATVANTQAMEMAKTSAKRKFPVALVGGIAGLLTAAGVVAVLVINGGGLFERDEETGTRGVAGSNTEQTADIETECLTETTASAESVSGETEAGTEVIVDYSHILPEDTIDLKIAKMNSSEFEEEQIEVYQENYKPQKGKKTAAWDDKVFYILEGYNTGGSYSNKNLCELEKRELKNKETGNLMQYEIYRNPDNGFVNKIVSIEYLSSGLEVTEYYYTNKGKVNFVYQYPADNYVASYATPDHDGQRFLYSNDALVTWRKVSDGKIKNYVIGKNEAKRMDNFAENTKVLYDDMDKKTKKKFRENEKRMLNAAYNTYNIVLNSTGIAHIQGMVYGEQSQGLPDAVVELYDADLTNRLYALKTDSQGRYSIIVPNEENEYSLKVYRSQMTECEIYKIRITKEQIDVYQNGVYLFDQSSQGYAVELSLGDAFERVDDHMKFLADAKIRIRRGINNTTGEVVLQSSSDNYGYAYITDIPAGVYTVEVQATGYETMFYTIIVNPDKELRYELYASPDLAEGEYAVVLTWGAYPEDLDSHLFTTSGSANSHVWYGNMSDGGYDSLDVDDTTSYGPETIRIRNMSASAYYKYCVVDFTNGSREQYESEAMSYSQACVNVYSSDGLVATYNVPTGRSGVIWEVFEIRNGSITPIERYYNSVQARAWWTDNHK